MVQIAGTYKLEKNENFADYLKALGNKINYSLYLIIILLFRLITRRFRRNSKKSRRSWLCY